MAFETFFLIFSFEGIASTAFTTVFVGFSRSVFFLFFYIWLANDFLTYENYDEPGEFTATFSRKNWIFLILSGIAAVATIMFYDKAFLVAVHPVAVYIIILGGVILSIFMAFFEKPFSTVTLCILYLIVTGIFIKSV